VFLSLLDAAAPTLVAAQPELMVRDWRRLPLEQLTVACGCGGGQEVATALPDVLRRARALVLDADGLNAAAGAPAIQHLLKERGAQGMATILTPHPLEAARLLGTTTARVQADRLQAAQSLVDRFGTVVVLKGSGTIVAAPSRPPAINPTGSAALATGGTGDVLAGHVAAALAAGAAPVDAACAAVYRHGALADRWPAGTALTAGALARAAAG
jgi:hydroxyethylthiazole kinase-like uncharacterized protein yjeF